MGGAAFRWLLQLHRDVPKAARFYSEGLDFSINVCTLRWAELQNGPLKLALMHSRTSDVLMQKACSSMLSFTVTDINSTVTKLMTLGAELDGPIKYEIHGKVEIHGCLHGRKALPRPYELNSGCWMLFQQFKILQLLTSTKLWLSN